MKGAVGETIRKAVQQSGFRIIRFPDQNTQARREKSAAQEIARADCIIADVTGGDPNVFFDLGIAQALGKAAFVLTQEPDLERLQVKADAVFGSFEYSDSPRGLRQLSTSLISALKEYRAFPRRPRFLLGSRARSLFAVDWDRIGRSDFENLCLELLTQLGFRRVNWEKNTPEIDLVAELPKKDPDGFEYRELWFVSLGRSAPPEMLIEMLHGDRDYFFHRMLRYADRFNIPRRDQQDTPITFLIISREDSSGQGELFHEVKQFRSSQSAPFGSTRIRVWDRNYLTNLVYQFPPIGFKYFSDEGRAESKFRKSPEDLYQENLELTERLAITIAELKDEKDKRVRAERDAVWKDISFAAAHKMGNPIFAIETNLDPLQRRITEQRTQDAIEVINDIRVSVDKAKGIVDQFKSLTIAQNIVPTAIRLRPLLDQACKIAQAGEARCEITCPDDLMLYADQERLAECLDELACNSLHWFDKAEHKMEIVAGIPDRKAVPEFLDSTRQYARILFRDNGEGVPIANKVKIFDAFFTTYHHGTGLGLALVRRIIEGHGGSIVECGVPGEGATFEIYLPLAVDTDTIAPTTQPRAIAAG